MGSKPGRRPRGLPVEKPAGGPGPRRGTTDRPGGGPWFRGRRQHAAPRAGPGRRGACPRPARDPGPAVADGTAGSARGPRPAWLRAVIRPRNEVRWGRAAAGLGRGFRDRKWPRGDGPADPLRGLAV